MQPYPLGIFGASTGDRFEVLWAGAVSESETGHEENETKDTNDMESHKKGVVFSMTESTSHVVIAGVDFFEWVCDSKIPDPNALANETLGEFEFWFSVFGGPIIDSKAPWKRMVCAVENWSGFFVSVVDIDHSEWCEVRVGNENDNTFVGTEAEILFEVFYQGFGGSRFILVCRFVVAIVVVCNEIFVGSFGIALRGASAAVHTS